MFRPLERIEGLSVARFRSEFLLRKPVVFTEPTGAWRPADVLTRETLLAHAAATTVKVRPRRTGYLAATRMTQYMPLAQYYAELDRWNDDVARGRAGDDYPPYLHDSPILKDTPALAQLLGNFPAGYLPPWYRATWPQLSLFFIGPSKGTTPLHFDSCETNNLFLQVSGRKKWIIIPDHELLEPFRVKWQWSAIDAEAPTPEQRHVIETVRPFQTELQPGDILYMPPRTWHQVRIVEPGVSFNLDWHTAKTAGRSLLSPLRGAPVRNAFAYNVPLFLGLGLGIPANWLLPWLSRHLDYVD